MREPDTVSVESPEMGKTIKSSKSYKIIHRKTLKNGLKEESDQWQEAKNPNFSTSMCDETRGQSKIFPCFNFNNSSSDLNKPEACPKL